MSKFMLEQANAIGRPSSSSLLPIFSLSFPPFAHFFFSNPSYFVIVAAQALNCFIMLDVIMPAVQFVAGHCSPGPLCAAAPGSVRSRSRSRARPRPRSVLWKLKNGRKNKRNAGKNWGIRRQKRGGWMRTVGENASKEWFSYLFWFPISY